jgi:hypothetical protein
MKFVFVIGTFPDKNVDIQVSVHDMFLEYPAPSLKIAFN